MATGVAKVVSGGQTGVDRAAWDAARACRIAIGGHVPKGRWAEDGAVPQCYGPLPETQGTDPAERTRRNVAAADRTLIICRGEAKGGTALTLALAGELGKPCLVIHLAAVDADTAAEQIRAWLEGGEDMVLNVAGPRASEDPGIYAEARAVLEMALAAPPGPLDRRQFRSGPSRA